MISIIMFEYVIEKVFDADGRIFLPRNENSVKEN